MTDILTAYCGNCLEPFWSEDSFLCPKCIKEE
jgi:hypothetical protein